MIPARRSLLRAGLALLILYAALLLAAGWWLPSLLLHPPVPQRLPGTVRTRLAALAPEGAWTLHQVAGGGGVPLQVHWLHRPGAKGAAILLHGFGDDALGTAPRLLDLPGFDILCFTFRGRDLRPEVPVTLGGHERADVSAVVRFLAGSGWPWQRQVLVGASQGAGVALLALADLEAEGPPLGGALLESPFRDLRDATRNHLRGTLGKLELLARPAERLALWRAGRLAGFEPAAVSPMAASARIRTPVALLAGSVDPITPLEGVRAIARHHPDLTIVPGANHLEAGVQVPGGWRAWADLRLRRWGLS
jgi:alpha-beta hydrolase superfamily lysophospholipase